MDSFLQVPDHLVSPPMVEEAVSVRVGQVCDTLKTVEISDKSYALKERWIPPRPINEIIARVLCPSIFMLQSALDPHFCNFSDGGYHLSATSYQKLAYTLRKQLELIQPEYPSYVEIWDGAGCPSKDLPEPPVSDRSKRLFEIFEEMILHYGYYDDCLTSFDLDTSLYHLKRVSACWAALLGMQGEFPEYLSTGQLMRKPASALVSISPVEFSRCFSSPIMDPGVVFLAYLLPAAQLRPLLSPLVLSKAEKGLGTLWSPGASFSAFLEVRVRPAVFFIQNAIDPKISLSLPFNVPTMEDRRFVQEALAEVLLQLDFLISWVFRETRELGTLSSSVNTPDLLFPSEALNMARILGVLVDEFGFGGFCPPSMKKKHLTTLRLLCEISLLTFGTFRGPKEFAKYNERGCLILPGKLDIPQPNNPSYSSRPEFEFIWIDLDSEAQLVEYLRCPSVARYCQTVLHPLCDIAMLVRNQFRGVDPAPCDSPWICQQLGAYMNLIVRLFFPALSLPVLLRFPVFAPQSHVFAAIDKSHSVAPGKRVATPSVTSLIYMMRLVRQFGFDSDETESVLDDFGQRLDVVFSHANVTAMAMSARMEYTTPDETVPAIEYRMSLLDSPSSDSSRNAVILGRGDSPASKADNNLYIDHARGVYDFFVEVVGPYGRLLNKAFPSCANTSADVSLEAKEFLIPHVGNFLSYLCQAYTIGTIYSALEHVPLVIPAEAIRTLSLMQKFHCLLGNPAYGPNSLQDDERLILVDRVLKVAHEDCFSSSDPIDLPYSPFMSHVPCVPSWTADQVLLLKAQEIVDPWVAERYWLRERVQDADRVGKDLSTLLTEVTRGEWFPEYLESLWITHVRCLGQALHETLQDQNISSIPPEIIQQARVGVKVMLSNMSSVDPVVRELLLGSIKIARSSDPALPAQYHIPHFCTVTFAMVESFVALVGYDGDEDRALRESMFGAIAHLQYCMALGAEYVTRPWDAPGFTHNSADPFVYGIGHHTKPDQVSEAKALGRLRHQFSQGLLRYNPALGKVAYQFPVCPVSQRIVPTRPNTPTSDSAV
ncbi:hypothetical protein B0H13DRAFT_1925768 [Mycena leptocephala]|nr:hypothetical protein B0H13DRAFT_1925768 [Mycena leptocephala]